MLGGVGRGLAGGVGGGELDAAAVVRGEDGGEGAVELFDQRGDGTEVGGERDEVEGEGGWVGDLRAGEFETDFFDAGEELGVGVAKEVDGLHGVADEEEGAASTVGPGAEDAGEELVLAAAGVLELVDEEVMDTVGDGDGGVGGKPVFAAEDALGDLGDLNEIDGGGFSEDDFELGGGVAEEGETGADDLPVLFGVAERREGADGGEGGLEGWGGGEASDERSEAGFACAAQGCGRESVGNAEALSMRSPGTPSWVFAGRLARAEKA